jgi:hypothetical protein
MADLKHAKDLQPSYDLALSHNGTEKWADNFAVRMIERIDDLERQLAEAKKLAEWTPITPENLPKEGWEVGRTSANDPLGPYNVRGVREVSQMLVDTCRDMDTWVFYGYRVTRPINPPQPEKEKPWLSGRPIPGKTLVRQW